MKKLSVFITTLNNAKTLPCCLESVKWADEIVVLDTFSSDGTVAIAEKYGAKLFQHEFLGYGRQKQSALEKTTNDWVLLLDADETLSDQLQDEIKQILSTEPTYDGFELPRQEQLFWRMSSRFTRFNYQLRFFRKSVGALSTDAVHAAPKVSGRVGKLQHPFLHFGEINIHTKVEKINAYSSGMVEDKAKKGKQGSLLTLILYPPIAFIQSYLFKRNIVNGSAGFIASVTMAYYAFLKYAKLREYHKFQKYGNSLLPDNAPDFLSEPEVPK
ncbi:MAG: glycosyltransferase family 2 protein [Desulfobulbaceae bacterium]|nr:MAG: glycosyltransferase family 2 protein [Desulfobulbaceae bacterium]